MKIDARTCALGCGRSCSAKVWDEGGRLQMVRNEGQRGDQQRRLEILENAVNIESFMPHSLIAIHDNTKHLKRVFRLRYNSSVLKFSGFNTTESFAVKHFQLL